MNLANRRFQSQKQQFDYYECTPNEEDEEKSRRKPDGTKLNIKPVIGLEVHAQLLLKSKLFSRGSNAGQAAPNSQLDLLDISLPGSLPKLNEGAIKAAILTGLALNCSIQDVIHFDRKNYFYTDMPAGFQITQYNKPIAKDGYIDFVVGPYHRPNIAHSLHYDVIKYLHSDTDGSRGAFEPYMKRSVIKQLQLEQDSAKTLHQTGLDHQEINNLVDYNRSGAALLEIVFEPDLTNPDEASALVKELIFLLRALNTCDCILQDGSLRVDANVSIHSIEGQLVDLERAGRVELKNLNSVKSLNRGIAHEIHRQASVIQSGDRVIRESRTFDSATGETIPLRQKEEAVDYRYVPEPSIPPYRINPGQVAEAQRELSSTEMPVNIRNVLVQKYHLSLAMVIEILDRPGLAHYLMEIVEGKSYDANIVADFLVYATANVEKIEGIPFDVNLVDKNGDFMQKLTPRKMQQLFDMLFEDKISFAIAYEVIKFMLTNDSSNEPEKIIQDFGWNQITDETEIERLCVSLISGMKNISKKYKKLGEKKHLRMMLVKLEALHGNRVSVKKAIYCLNKLLRPH